MSDVETTEEDDQEASEKRVLEGLHGLVISSFASMGSIGRVTSLQGEDPAGWTIMDNQVVLKYSIFQTPYWRDEWRQRHDIIDVIAAAYWAGQKSVRPIDE